MIIGLFSDTYSPQINGVATSVSILKGELEARGHLVYVFTTTDPNSEKNEANVYRLPSIPFTSTRRISMPYNPHLVRLIKEMRLDLVHTHTEFSLGIFGRAMARNLDIPLVHTMHTIYEKYTHYITRLEMMDPIAKLAARKWSRYFCNWADEIIVPTEKVKRLLLSYGVRRNISVIPTGIELDKFSRSGYDSEAILKLRADLCIMAHEKVLLYVGRISEEKILKKYFGI